jgi:hypothetical protein
VADEEPDYVLAILLGLTTLAILGGAIWLVWR